MIFTPNVQADRARDDRGLQILSRSRYEKYWGLNFGSLHTPVWGRLSTKGNRPEEVITPNTGSLGSLQEFHKITRTRGFSDSEFELETPEQKRTDGSLIWKYERNAGLDGSWRSHVQPLSGYWNHEQTVFWF
jgi:hypothetical protein